MVVFDLYSKRRKRAMGDVPDVLTYDNFSQTFRRQVSYWVDDALGSAAQASQASWTRDAYQAVVLILRREYGVNSLTAGSDAYHCRDLHCFIESQSPIDRTLDAIELVLHYVEASNFKPRDPAALIEELNARFKEHGYGYQYESGEIIRTDSKLVHQEVVRPALALLSEPAFVGANEEMLQAFDHHRRGGEKDVLTWALKALESTLKIICAARGWQSTGKGQAKDLLDTVFAQGLIEPIWQAEFAGLRAILEGGVPTARNKLGGHGQGGQPITVPAYLAAFVLHQTAAAIVFLVEAHRAKP